MLEGASVNELDALERLDLIPADNADSCHSSADASHREAAPRLGGFFVSGAGPRGIGCRTAPAAGTMPPPEGRLAQLVRALP